MANGLSLPALKLAWLIFSSRAKSSTLDSRACDDELATGHWPLATWCSVRSSSRASSKCQRPWGNIRSSAQAASTWPMKRS